jgi:hypothetical protein
MKNNDRSLHSVPSRALHKVLALALTLLVPLLVSCGEGGGFAATGGIGGTGISSGSVTAFGSIFVNGVEWSTSSATVEIDGVVGDDSDLRLGMVVRVEGSRSSNGLTGTASQITFDDSLEGPIEAAPVLNGARKSFTIFGQAVIVEDGITVFDDGATFANLAMDDVVEVSGLPDETGAIRATRLELKGTFTPGVSRAELKGTISGLDRGMQEFTVSGVLVQYASAVFDDLTEADLADGLLIEAEGVLSSAGILVADRIERENVGLGVDDADDVELEGFVSGYVSDANFMVSGVQVDASLATFEPAGLMLVDGLHVEVDGDLVAGVLQATKVELEDNGGNNDSRIDAAASQDASGGVVIVLGVEVRADGSTRIEDKRDGVPNFRFEDIRAGDWLRIEGVADGTDSILASRIERDDVEDDVELRGPVTAFDTTPGSVSIDIFDQPMPIDGGTFYFDEFGVNIGEAAFFGLINLGTTVKATDQDAVDAAVLGEVDEMELEN